MRLDLHGIKHIDVVKVVDEFLYLAMKSDLHQVFIITGNSMIMKNMTKNIVNEYGFNSEIDINNSGVLIVNLV